MTERVEDVRVFIDTTDEPIEIVLQLTDAQARTIYTLADALNFQNDRTLLALTAWGRGTGEEATIAAWVPSAPIPGRTTTKLERLLHRRPSLWKEPR